MQFNVSLPVLEILSIFVQFRCSYFLYLSISIHVVISTWLQIDGAVKKVEPWLLSASSESRQYFSILTWQEWKHLSRTSLAKARSKLNQPKGIEQLRNQINIILLHCRSLAFLHSSVLYSWYQYGLTSNINYCTYSNHCQLKKHYNTYKYICFIIYTIILVLILE